MIVTRDLINKNIAFKDIIFRDDDTKAITREKTFFDDIIIKKYSFDELSELIDICKNALQRNGAKPGETALIGELAGKMQTALVFACTELGLTINIIDHNRPDHWQNTDYIDIKTKLLLPIDYYLVDKNNRNIISMSNFNIFSKVCNKVISMSDEEIDTTPNNTIGATKDSILMKCTSSGTTGIPKVITHNHEFMSSLIQRNSKFFDGSVFVIYNLNHGSSPATYFFPALASKNTEKILSASLHDIVSHSTGKPKVRTKIKELFKNRIKFDHLMIPYPSVIEPFLKSGIYPETTLYTLTTIDKTWKYYQRDGRIKDIISIFGSNETCGPIFINKLSDKNFDPHYYSLVDKFYKVELVDGKYHPEVKREDSLEVSLPIYNKKVNTNDIFLITEDGRYFHKGRNDLLRVNGVEIPTDYQTKIGSLIIGDLVIDTINNALYLAIWEEYDKLEEIVKTIDQYMKSYSNGSHYISKYQVLNHNDFEAGVKLDQEILRDYFRDEQNNYQTVDQIDKKL